MLETTRRTTSPRFLPPPTPVSSLVIHFGVAALWLILFARAFFLHGLLAWSTGLVYVSYDTALLAFVFWQTLPLATGQPLLEASGGPATLGVIVAAHNEAATLPITLEALFAQAEPPEAIVIADDGSRDATAAILFERYGLAMPALGAMSDPSPTHPALRWLRLPHGGKAVALNSAIAAIETELVVTLDADTLLEPDAIAAVRRAFAASPALVAATGVLRPVCGPSLSGRLFTTFQNYEYMRNFLSRYAWTQLHSLLLISGAFAGFRRSAVMLVGGFDPDCLVEDYELIHRLRRYGVLHGLDWDTTVIGGARARTDAPAAVGSFLRQRRRWFGGFLQTQYWYRDMVGSRRYGWLGLAMLPVKAIDTVQPLYGLTAFALLIGYGLGGQFGLLAPVAGVIGLKIVIDFAFHLWSVYLYRRWTGWGMHLGYGPALLVSLVEPFSFQLLRHLGAAWGWVTFLTGDRTWGVQHRLGLVPPAEREAP